MTNQLKPMTEREKLIEIIQEAKCNWQSQPPTIMSRQPISLEYFIANAILKDFTLKTHLREAVKVIKNLMSLNESNLSVKERAIKINAPEDEMVLELCEQIGFGALIDSAVRQWYLRDEVGCFTCGHCLGTIEAEQKKAEQTLSQLKGVLDEKKT